MDTLGWILVEQGEVRRGTSLLEKAISITPEAVEIHYHYAVGLYKSGNKAEARRELEQLLNAKKSFPQREEAKRLLDTL